MGDCPYMRTIAIWKDKGHTTQCPGWGNLSDFADICEINYAYSYLSQQLLAIKCEFGLLMNDIRKRHFDLDGNI